MLDLISSQQQFLKSLERSGKSFNTLKNYRADLGVFNKFLTTHKRPLQLKTLTLTQAKEYSAYLEQISPSPNSIRRRVQTLRLFFDFLMREFSYPDNPIKLMPVASKVLDTPTPPAFRDLIRAKEYLENLVANQSGLNRLIAYRNLLIFTLIYEAGLKVSDLARLELSDVLPDKQGLRILIRPMKRDPYSIPLSQSFKTIWKGYKTELLQAWPGPGTVRFVLFNANPHQILAGSLSPRGTELFFEELRQKFKFDMTARSLRQACVFKWMCLKTSESQIKEWLGVAPSYDLSLYQTAFTQAKTKPHYVDLIYA